MSLLTEAAYLAIQDAGLTKEDIDGFRLRSAARCHRHAASVPKMAEHMGIYPTWATARATPRAPPA